MERLTELFGLMDDFCRRFEPAGKQRQLTAGAQKRRRRTALSLSELVTLVVLFHPLRFRQFQRFYLIAVFDRNLGTTPYRVVLGFLLSSVGRRARC